VFLGDPNCADGIYPRTYDKVQIELTVKNFRWWLIFAFALFMARPTTKRCTMCVDRWRDHEIPAVSAPAEEPLNANLLKSDFDSAKFILNQKLSAGQMR